MDGNIDMDPRDVAALEERLYSQFHHSSEVTPNSEKTFLRQEDNGPSRIVSRTSIVNNSQSSQLMSKMKRYWATAEGHPASQRPYLQQPNRTNQTSLAPLDSTHTNGNSSRTATTESKRMYTTPYQSLLGNSYQNFKDNRPIHPMDPKSKVTDEAFNVKKAQSSVKPKRQRKLQKKLQFKKKHQLAKQHLENIFHGRLKLVNRDISQFRKEQFLTKKAKAVLTRKLSVPRVVAQVFLSSSDDESKSAIVVTPGKSNMEVQSDGDADEVVIVPLPEPPKICIDSSDDEVAQDSFAFPRTTTSTKKVTVTKFNSPRCLSPSNSSIMSDDFIGLHDRSRLNESFSGNVPNDDELECSLEVKRNSAVRQEKATVLPSDQISRDQRAPSISSEGTVCTSSDTTDQDKHRQACSKGNKSKSLPPSRGDIVTAAENGQKDETNQIKSPAQPTSSKQPDKASLENTTVPPILPSPCGPAKKGTTKKATPSVPAAEPMATSSRTQIASPISMALEFARKHFEGSDASENAASTAKTKSKKARKSDANQSSVGQDFVSSKWIGKKSAAAQKKGGTTDVDSIYQVLNESTTKERAVGLPFSDESVSSESDYDLSLVDHRDSSATGQEEQPSLVKESLSMQHFGKAFPGLDEVESESSESELEVSFLQTLKSTPKSSAKALPLAKRVGPKRKQFNSETYSDEDFACMLTDIVRAVSDEEEEEEEEEDAPDAVTSTTTVIVGQHRAAQEKQTKAAKLSSKKQKRTADASAKAPAASSAGGGLAGAPNDWIAEKCPIVASSITVHDGGTQEMQTKADGPSSSKKKKRPHDASNAASSTSVPDAGHHDDGGDNGAEIIVAQTSTSKIIELASASWENQSFAEGSAAKKKKRWHDISSAGVAGSIIDVDTQNEYVVCEPADLVADNTDTHTKRRTQSMELPDCAWNEEMKQFYNGDWMDNNFSLYSVMRKMPRGKNHWPILQQDLYPDPPKREVICNKCGEPGHMRYQCRNARKAAICRMCGEQGHEEPRCPRTICLNCGAKTRNFVRGCYACARDLFKSCRLCGVRGHGQRYCPDMWRRYHSTTIDNIPLKRAFEVNKKIKCCCICCKQGHQAHECTAAYRIFGQAVPTMHIKSYQQTYPTNRKGFNQSRAEQSGDEAAPRYNLLSEDANECELNLHELARNQNGFYYRFAKSSGLLKKHEQRLNQQAQAITSYQQHLQHQEQEREEQQQQQQQQEQEQEQKNQQKQQDQEQEQQEQQQEEQQQQQQQNQQLQQQQLEQQQKKQRHEQRQSQQQKQEEENDTEEYHPLNVTETSREKINEPIDLPVATLETDGSNHSFSRLIAEKEKSVADRYDESAVAEATEEASTANESVSAKDAVQSVQTKVSEEWPDFIPLSSGAEQERSTELRNPDPEPEPEPKPKPKPMPEPVQLPLKEGAESKVDFAVGKIPLSKEHAKRLLSTQGSDFLNDAAKRHSLKLSISFEMIGNVLLLTGREEAQKRFHEELRTFLRGGDVPKQNANNPIPSKKRRAFQVIFDNLWKLETRKHEVHTLYRSYQQALANSCTSKTTRRHRAALNMVLFGQFGLREGKRHLETLRDQLLEAMDYKTTQDLLLPDRRTAILDAYMYIFSDFDHMNYSQVVNEYEQLRRINQLNKFVWSDLNLPWFRKDSPQMKFLRQCKRGQFKSFVDNQERWHVKRRVLKHRGRDLLSVNHRQQADIVLNTQDQMIDPASSFLKLSGIPRKLSNMLIECRRLTENVYPRISSYATSVIDDIEKIANSDSQGLRIDNWMAELVTLRDLLRKNQLVR